MRSVWVYGLYRKLPTCDSYGIQPVQSFVKTFTKFCFFVQEKVQKYIASLSGRSQLRREIWSYKVPYCFTKKILHNVALVN